jgi:hypothetical protein
MPRSALYSGGFGGEIFSSAGNIGGFFEKWTLSGY